MTLLLALDLATVAGWAYWKPGMDRPRYGRWNLPENVGDELERVTMALRRHMRDLHAVESFEHGTVLIEAPIRVKHDKERNLRLLMGLASEAATTALELGASPRDIKHDAMMQWWVGSARLSSADGKAYSMMAAKARGWTPKDHNAADALGLLTHYAGLWKIAVPWDCRRCPAPEYLDMKLKGILHG